MATYWTRGRAAKVITNRYFQISERQLIRWKVPLVYLNGRAHGLDSDWINAAEARLADMLKHQGAEHQAVLRLAKAGQARTKALREQRRQAGARA
jgi:hypothetical protein